MIITDFFRLATMPTAGPLESLEYVLRGMQLHHARPESADPIKGLILVRFLLVFIFNSLI